MDLWLYAFKNSLEFLKQGIKSLLYLGRDEKVLN
jgi:hypothetical protein